MADPQSTAAPPAIYDPPPAPVETPPPPAVRHYLGPAVALAVLLLVALVTTRWAPAIRRALMIETRVTADSTGLPLSDAQDRAALEFFDQRDSAVVRVPYDMTVGELLALYQLESNPSAQEAIAAATRRRAPVPHDVPLKAGQAFTILLTPPSHRR